MADMAETEQLPVAQAKAGDPAAWEALFRRYRLPLYVYIFEMVRNEETSFDLVQETMINAVRHIGTLREEQKIGGWLFGIAHQKCVQWFRRQSREDLALKEVAEEPIEFQDDAGELLVRREQESEFMQLLENLPAAQRSALLLYFVEQFTLAEIAAISDVSVGTVKSRLHYGKIALRELWEVKNT